MSTVRLTCFIIGVVGGLILCVYPVMARKRSDIARWSYSLAGILGFFAICWAALGLTEAYYSSQITTHAWELFEHYRALSGGVGIGLFLAWCISGEFGRLCRRRSHVGT